MQRIQWIDVAKGWGIVFLIYGHITNDLLSKWIYTFHIPLFFFLSGYVFNPNKKFPEFLISKTKSLLLPYLTLGIPLILINLYWGYNLFSILKSFFIQERMFPLWFLTSLFLQLLTAYFILNKIKSVTWQALTTGILAILGLMLWRLGIKAIPWNYDISLVTLPFFYLGYYLRKKESFQKIMSKEHFSTFLFLFFILNISGFIVLQNTCCPTVDLFDSKFGFEPITYPTALFGILGIVVFSNRFIIRSIQYIGKNTLVFFAWQQDIALIIVGSVLKHFSIFTSTIGVYMHHLIMLISAIIILYVLNEIILRTKLRVFIGK